VVVVFGRIMASIDNCKVSIVLGKASIMFLDFNIFLGNKENKVRSEKDKSENSVKRD
jgi:hypothetical protein